jgi:hypothetical protein
MVDRNIDSESNVSCVADQCRYFGELADVLSCTVWHRKEDVGDVLGSADYAHRILYIFSHHRGAGSVDAPNLGEAGVSLTDGPLITADDVQNWRDGRDFTTRPFIFINGCDSAHMTTLLYPTLAKELLLKRALGLIGAQVELPIEFAAEYARRFFRRLLIPDGPEPARVGHIVRDLARTFIREHKNPLGLVYTLYRGLDCYVARGPAVRRGAP